MGPRATKAVNIVTIVNVVNVGKPEIGLSARKKAVNTVNVVNIVNVVTAEQCSVRSARYAVESRKGCEYRECRKNPKPSKSRTLDRGQNGRE